MPFHLLFIILGVSNRRKPLHEVCHEQHIAEQMHELKTRQAHYYPF